MAKTNDPQDPHGYKSRPMTADDLIRWEIRMGFRTQQEAAASIGKDRDWYRRYQRGEKPIPLTVALACAAVEHGLKPLPRKSRR